jgi:hypothetical protein
VWWPAVSRRPFGLVCEEDEGDDWCEDECEKDCCSEFHLRVLPFAYDQNLARRCAIVKQCFAYGSKRIFLPVMGKVWVPKRQVCEGAIAYSYVSVNAGEKRVLGIIGHDLDKNKKLI